MDRRFEDIEVRMSYLEHSLEALDQVVIKQQERIDLLIAELMRTKQQVESGAEFVRPQSEDTPPPHY